MSGPDWKDLPATKCWLEQRYTGNAQAGSPLYQYLITLGRDTDQREEHLSVYELAGWRSANNIESSSRCPTTTDSMILYPEYDHSTLSSANGQLISKSEQKETKEVEEKETWTQSKRVKVVIPISKGKRRANEEQKEHHPRRTSDVQHVRPSKVARLSKTKSPNGPLASSRTLRSGPAGRKQGSKGQSPMRPRTCSALISMSLDLDLVCLDEKGQSTIQNDAGP